MLINVMLIKKYVNIKSKNLTHFEFSRLATMYLILLAMQPMHDHVTVFSLIEAMAYMISRI